MKTMLGVSTKGFDGDSLIDKYRSIAKHGFRYVNIHLDKDYTRKEINTSIKCFKQLKLHSGQISSAQFPTIYNNIKNINKALELGKNLCDIQKLLGGKQVSMYAGTFIGDKNDSFGPSVRIIRELCDYASKFDMIIALSVINDKDQLVSTWNDIRKLFTKVDRENLMLNLDTKFLGLTKPDMRMLGSFCESIAQFQINEYNIDLENNDITEGIIDIKEWAQKIMPFVKDSMTEVNGIPSSVLILKSTDSKEIRYALDYLAMILPELEL